MNQQRPSSQPHQQHHHYKRQVSHEQRLNSREPQDSCNCCLNDGTSFFENMFRKHYLEMQRFRAFAKHMMYMEEYRHRMSSPFEHYHHHQYPSPHSSSKDGHRKSKVQSWTNYQGNNMFSRQRNSSTQELNLKNQQSTSAPKLTEGETPAFRVNDSSADGTQLKPPGLVQVGKDDKMA